MTHKATFELSQCSILETVIFGQMPVICGQSIVVSSIPRIPIQAPGVQLGACCGRNGRYEEGLRQAGLPG
jgi:hypothetical protein